ncbi:hypothetical protein P4238_10470 [Pseudomonas aeruginosa]|nr:hypothetical protein [Pseudomonas aeruginosa]
MESHHSPAMLAPVAGVVVDVEGFDEDFLPADVEEGRVIVGMARGQAQSAAVAEVDEAIGGVGERGERLIRTLA